MAKQQRAWKVVLAGVAATAVGCTASAPSAAKSASIINGGATQQAPVLPQATHAVGGATLVAATGPAGVAQKIATAFKRKTHQASQPAKPAPKPSDTSDPISVFTKTKPADAGFFVALARVSEQNRDFAAAAEQYKKALELEPENLQALLGVGRLHDRQGQLGDATKYYLLATKHQPRDPAAFNDLGLCYARQGRFDESIEALSHAVELQQGNPKYRNNIATVLVEVGRVDEAIRHMAAAQSEPVAHYNVGFLLYRRGQTDAAAQQFALALQQDPGMEAARHWLDVLSKPGGPGQPSRLAPAQAMPVQRPARPQAVPAPAQGPMLGSPAVPPSEQPPAPRPDDPVARKPASRPSVVPREARYPLRPTSLPQWGAKGDTTSRAAAPPTPESLGDYPVVDVDPSLGEPGAAPLLEPLPPTDPAYFPPSRY